MKTWSLVLSSNKHITPSQPLSWAAWHLGAALCPPAAHTHCSPASPEHHLKEGPDRPEYHQEAARTRKCFRSS